LLAALQKKIKKQAYSRGEYQAATSYCIGLRQNIGRSTSDGTAFCTHRGAAKHLANALSGCNLLCLQRLQPASNNNHVAVASRLFLRAGADQCV